MNRRVNLLMPVYRGDEWWPLALDSVAASRTLLGDVIISFDGPRRVEQSEYLLELYSESINPISLVTPEEYTWVEHIRWIMRQQPIVNWPDDQYLLILSDDDVLRPQALGESLAMLTQSTGAVLFGPWEIGNRANDPDPLRVPAPGPSLVRTPDIAGALAAWTRAGNYTSISGLAFPMKAFRTFVLAHGTSRERPLFNGIRAEYLLATQPSINSLIQTKEPIVAIHEHPDQGGRHIPRSIRLHDEGLFQLWVAVGRQETSSVDRVIALIRHLRRVLQHPKLLRDIPRAIRVFRSVPKGNRSFSLVDDTS